MNSIRACFDPWKQAGMILRVTVMRRLLVPALVIALPAICLRAAEPLPGHSVHGEAFDEGPRQAAVLIEGCGKIKFPITTKSAEAQKFFVQGVGQIHGFWYYEAERSFRQVAMLDPDCAMAYWGCAMANVNNEKRAAGFIAEATKRKAQASKREQAWIDALQKFYADLKKDKKLRSTDFIKDLEGIIHDNPDDLESKAFLAWAIWKAKDAGVAMVSRESVDAIVRQVFAKEPLHPAHHYIIHLWDDSKPARAVTSAAQCGQSEPGIAHMWHMPGHTFSKVDRYVDAAWQQEAATRVDHAYMIRTQILPDQIHNYAHNTEWLIRTWNQLGRADDSVELAKNLIEIPRHPTWNSIEKKSNSAAFGRTRLLETLLKFEMWDEMLALDGSRWLDVTQNPSYEANRLRALGIAAASKGDKARVRQLLGALSKLKTKPAPAQQEKKPEPVTPAARTTTAERLPLPKKEAITSAPASAPAQTTAGAKSDTKAAVNTIVDNAFAELQALLAMLEGKQPEEVQKLLDAAKDTPKDRLVRYQLKLGNKEKAATLANQLPSDAPGLALRVDALVQCGKMDEAKTQFEIARKKAALLDTDLPMSRRLDAIAAQLGMDKAWRQPEETRKDSGVRPSLDSLGPIHWHPWQAAGFTLPDVGGKEVALKNFAGKPVVVLFYLGSTCSHCMEQLKAFTSMAKDYEAAGIQILAIGSEDSAGLTTTSNTCDARSGAPFPLLSDAALKVFKTWRCHDDFEQSPLHGAFLVDGKGQVRWADISYQPLKDAKFLLGEAKRLLAIP